MNGEVYANPRCDQLMWLLGQSEFPSCGKIKMSSGLDVLSLKYIYTIQVEILKSIKEYGSIIHKKILIW